VSTTQSYTGYTINGTLEVTLPSGSQCGGIINLAVSAQNDITDDEVSALQQALVAAFPAAWNVTNDDITIQKQGQSITSYATNYTTNPPSFS